MTDETRTCVVHRQIQRSVIFLFGLVGGDAEENARPEFVICYRSFVISPFRRAPRAGDEAVRNKALRRTSPIQPRRSRRQRIVPQARPSTPSALWSNKRVGYYPKAPRDGCGNIRIRVPLSEPDRSQ